MTIADVAAACGLALGILALVPGCGAAHEEMQQESQVTAGETAPVLEQSSQTLMATGGDPIPMSSLSHLTWNWVELDGVQCRDGTGSGIAVRPNKNWPIFDSDTKKLLIFLQGGGACFDFNSCFINPDHFDGDNFDDLNTSGESLHNGIFDRSRSDNPVRDWNQVFIPYCTGDLHAGDNPDGSIPYISHTNFVGYRNMGLILDTVLATLPNVTEVVLHGTSAGAWGAMLNANRLAQRLPANVKFTIVNDSGPFMASDVHAPCLQDKMRQAWNFDDTVLSECGASCPDSSDYIADFAHFAMSNNAAARFAFISAMHDSIIRMFLAAGQDDCENQFSVLRLTPADEFAAGILDLKSRWMAEQNQVGTYLIDSPWDVTLHTFTAYEDRLYTTAENGVDIRDWYDAAINGSGLEDPATAHVGP